MKKIILTIIFILMPFIVHAKCVNTASYSLKGYFEDANNNPVTGKTLSQVLFDVFYDDGTSSTGNAATAEMGQGWYRYTYTSNAKNGIWVVRDSTSSYKNFPGGILEQLCDSQVANYDSTGAVLLQSTQTGVTIPTVTSVTNGVTLVADAIDASKIAAGAIGTSEMGSTSGTVTTGSCTNTTTQFDTDRTDAGVDHWKDAFLTFKDDTTTVELRGQTKAVTASAINGCLSVIGGFSTTPTAGDTFVIINK